MSLDTVFILLSATLYLLAKYYYHSKRKSYLETNEGRKNIFSHIFQEAKQPVENGNINELNLRLQFYEDILNNLPNDLVVFDTQHRYKFINPVAIKNKELREFMINKTDFDYCTYRNINPLLAQKRHERFKLALKSKVGIEWEDVKQKDNMREVVSRRFFPIRNAVGEVKHVIGYGLDISKLRQIEYELLTELQEREQMMNNLFTGIVITDNKLLILDVNDTTLNLLGYSKEKMLNSLITDFIEPPFNEAISGWLSESSMRLAFSNLQHKLSELQIKNKSGKTITVEIHTQIFSESNKLVFFIHNITAKYEHRLELEKLASFPQENPNPVMRLHINTLEILYANNAAHKMIGDNLKSNADMLKELYSTLKLSTGSDVAVSHQCFLSNKWWSFTIVPNSALEYANVYATDITDVKRAENNLNQLNKNLASEVAKRTKEIEESNSNYKNFAYAVSHDIKAPLRHISAFEQLTRKALMNNNTEDAISFLNEIKGTVKRLDAKTSALLQLSRIDSGKIDMGYFSIRDLFEKAIETYKLFYGVEQLVYTYNGAEMVCGDGALIGVVVDNLISNAIKYSREKEEVYLSVTVKDEELSYLFCVADNGVGFNMEYTDKIFSIFKRAHENSQYHGLGIGLSFVKKIIEKHGGSIWAESKEGIGTKFFFSLPKGE